MVKRDYKVWARRLIFAALLVLFAAVGVVAAVHLFAGQSGYAQAQDEYTALRQYAPDAKHAGQTTESEPPLDLSDINPDYIGWIRVDGTMIDYPVVRGEDNERYIGTTFSGERNASGAIFMDYRCADGFDGPLAVIYGHNMKDGSMFAELNRYLENGYLDEHPEIGILTPDGKARVYRVFAVIKTDVTDAVYNLPDDGQEAVTRCMAALGAPEDAERYIALSTCTSGGNDAERLLVCAAR